jgi:hypothetical protein
VSIDWDRDIAAIMTACLPLVGICASADLGVEWTRAVVGTPARFTTAQ